MSQFQVLKPFSGERPYKTGEVISLEGRNLNKLVELRYLAPVDDAAKPAPKPVAAPSAPDAPAPKKRGRPKGSKNKPKSPVQAADTPSVP
jgi:hypothetical protein